MPIKKEIIYPVFLECCQFADDVFWENIFEELAYGKTPYGTYVYKDFLCCSYKRKEFTYKIEKKEAQTIYNEVNNLLTHKLGLLSNREKTKKKKVFSDLEETMKESRKNWSNIKKKNTKELLIELYVTRMKNKHSLTIKQSRNLLSIITLALVFKVITSEDIVYKNDHIVHIEGINFNKKKLIIERGMYSFDISFAPNIVLDKKSMADNWEKYLKDLRKISVR